MGFRKRKYFLHCRAGTDRGPIVMELLFDDTHEPTKQKRA